jgi:palmitoyl transferase
LFTSLLAALSLTLSAAAFADDTPASSTSETPETPQSVVVVGTPETDSKSAESKPWYKSAWDTAGQHLSDIWTKGDIELYVPFWSYHLPYAYSPEKRASYTEYPAGGGIGKGWYNASGNWEGIYVMGFQDSHAQPMYMAGYGWVPTWNPINEKSRVGVGATVFLFMRSDINYYAPTPGILPMASVGYGPIDVQVAYIPGGEGNGNVLFWWAKYSFK